MSHDIKQYVINYFFIFIIAFISIYLYDIHSSGSNNTTRYNLANPLGIKIVYADVVDNRLSLSIYNPNNFTVSFMITVVGIRNNLGSTAAITHGGDIGMIINVPPGGYSSLSVPVFSADPKNVILQWEKTKGNLTISLYYNDISGRVSGVITTKITD